MLFNNHGYPPRLSSARERAASTEIASSCCETASASSCRCGPACSSCWRSVVHSGRCRRPERASAAASPASEEPPCAAAAAAAGATASATCDSSSAPCLICSSKQSSSLVAARVRSPGLSAPCAGVLELELAGGTELPLPLPLPFSGEYGECSPRSNLFDLMGTMEAAAAAAGCS